MNVKSVKVINVGCKANYHDSLCIENHFREFGYQIIDSSLSLRESKADIYVINSCTVTHKADRDSLGFAKKLKGLFPESIIFFTGCMAEINKDEIEKFAVIDYLIDNKNKFNIPKLILNNHKIERQQFWEENLPKNKINSFGRTRGFLKIQDGCNSKCSFCIVCKARGPERSMSADDVIDQLREYVKEGFKEVNLTGIRIGRFGGNNKSFLELLERIEKTNEITLRIRIGSLYPNEISDEFIDFLVSSKKICKHLHISQQSLDDEILLLMNRQYEGDLLGSIVKKIKNKIPNCFIGSDFIVGFPGEKNENFINTINRLNNIELSDIHVFTYSPRKGTSAYTFKDRLDEVIKRDRAKKLKLIAEEKKINFYNQALGNIEEILVEKSYKSKILLKGITDNYIPVKIKYDDKIINQIVKVKLDKVYEGVVEGEVVYEK